MSSSTDVAHLLEELLGNAHWWKDGLLRALTDAEGYVPLVRLLQFPQLRTKKVTSTALCGAVCKSKFLELSDDKSSIRWAEGRQLHRSAGSEARPDLKTPRFLGRITRAQTIWSKGGTTNCFKACTWNVLAGHIYDDWQKREDSIVGQILRLMPDVIALQEVQIKGVKQDPMSPSFGRRKHHGDRLLDLLKGHGFEGVYQFNVRAKNSVMLLWRSEMFKEAAPPTVSFATPSFKGRELIVTLSHIPSGRKVLVGTSHARVPLEQGALRQDWPLEDVTVVTKELQSLVAAEEQASRTGRRFGEPAVSTPPAVIFMGDFNSQPSADTYKYLSSTSTGLSLQSAYSAVLGAEPLATNINPSDDFADCIDYIFFGRRSLKAVAVLEPFDQRSAAIRCKQLGGNVGTPRSSAAAAVRTSSESGAGSTGSSDGTLGDHSLAEDHSLARFGMQGCSFPNRMNPSDHMPLLAMLEFGEFSEVAPVAARPVVPASAAKVAIRPSMPCMALPQRVLSRVTGAAGEDNTSPMSVDGDGGDSVAVGGQAGTVPVLHGLGGGPPSSSKKTPAKTGAGGGSSISSISSINSILNGSHGRVGSSSKSGAGSGRKASAQKVSFVAPEQRKPPSKLSRTVCSQLSLSASLLRSAISCLACCCLIDHHHISPSPNITTTHHHYHYPLPPLPPPLPSPLPPPPPPQPSSIQYSTVFPEDLKELPATKIPKHSPGSSTLGGDFCNGVTLRASTETKLTRCFEYLDSDGNGKINGRDFDNRTAEAAMRARTNQKWKMLRKAFDFDNSGSVSAQEFRAGMIQHAMAQLPLTFTATFDQLTDHQVIRKDSRGRTCSHCT
jgi:endonuclease/exonuclease/phosphatase family metal-dependent hydrolase